MADSDITTTASSEQVPTPPSQDQPKVALDEISSKVWPPNQGTRDDVIYRLLEALSTPSAFSKECGIIPCDVASAVVSQFENEAFATADGLVHSNCNGMEILQVYSKHLSKLVVETVMNKRMLETFKTRITRAKSYGIVTLRVYSKKISKQMLETINPRTATGFADVETLTTTEDVPAAIESDT